MRFAVTSIALAAMLSACATQQSATAMLSGQSDAAQMSCRQIEAELSVMGQAYMSSTAKERRLRGSVSAEAFLSPASFGAPAPTASARLKARVDELRRASRVKRCASIWADRAATA